MEKIRKYLKKTWPYWVGGILLGLMNVILLALVGMNWQITSGFLLWGVGILKWMGFNPLKWEYFSHFQSYYGPLVLEKRIFINQYTLLNIGVILGSLVATLLASQFKFKKIKNIKQIFIALAGGIMMGYGSRITAGCNIGAFFSGIPSFSLHGWVFGIFSFLGVGIGIKLLIRFIL
ncbi:MAG TPA: YeeE/YedE family protein [Epulopiscium sp.]|nr:YeeE/YedE family protein [Candidatus Epulonipiscium sp.]